MELSTLSKENISESSVNVDRMVKKKRPNLRYYFLKRTTDIILGLSILLVTSPILILIAIGVKIDSRGPVLYAREQVGKDSKRFIAYKFRTMTQNNDDREYKNYLVKYIQENEPYKIDSNGTALYKVTDDPRVTKFGAFLRRTNLDEFPQLINVLKGEMSFVGPRPDIPYAVKMYNKRHKQRLQVKPGITGIWQIRDRKSCSFEEMISLDIEYMNKQSLTLDFKIILSTVGIMLKGDGS